MPLTWQAFVLAAPAGTRAHYLAAVVGQPAAAVQALRAAAGAGRRGRGKAAGFAALFAQWHGRDPEATDWPAPLRCGQGSYEWLAPEDALLASLVGRMDADAIAVVLTERLRQVTGDPQACRNAMAVKLRTNRLGLVSSDLVGGITVKQAAQELGSEAIIRNAIANKALRTRRLGRLLVIPHAEWQAWKASRLLPPPGYVPLARIREALAIRSDKLSEFAGMGYIPTAVRCRPAAAGQKSTKFGTWYVDPDVARQLVADRHAGRPMPWHGKPLRDNLRATWKLWTARQHPAACSTCAQIWGPDGAPATFEEYCRRYPPLAHGAKRHLTRKWTGGISVGDLARECGKSYSHVQRAIANGALRAEKSGRAWRITRTDATRWKARRCPTGEGERSWISFATAKAWYGFGAAELRRFVEAGQLEHRIGTAGPQRGVTLVSRQQCADLRQDIGYTEAEAAARVGVPLGAFRELLAGVNWRGSDRIPLVTVQAVIKRLKSQCGYTIAEAAARLRVPEAWIHERIQDGTIRIARARWDRRRLYVTAPMLERLKLARKQGPKARKPSSAWLQLSAAAALAGMSTATIHNWDAAGDLTSRPGSDGTYYSRRSVLARARRYWTRPKFKRAVPPAWFQSEVARAHA